MPVSLYKTKFENFIRDNNLFSYSDKILLAVSGGIDSSTMAYLFKISQFKFAIAHCNFMLRGVDSIEDEKFVNDIANKYKVDFFTNKFDTITYAKKHKLSIQEAARELRYEWFLKLLNEQSFKYVAVAHHKTDLIETMLINILRRTGLYGLKGFLAKTGKIVRPLLCFDTQEISDLAYSNDIAFRLDKSNLDDKYLRNRIRKYIIPNLKKVENNFIESFIDTAKNLCDQGIIVKDYIDLKKHQLLKQGKNYKYINICKLKALNNYKIILYEIFKTFGANRSIINSLDISLDHNETKQFNLKNLTIIKTQDKIIILDKAFQQNYGELIINEYLSFNELILNEKLFVDICNNTDNYTAYFDSSTLSKNLYLRYWQAGDKLTPFGMTSQKNISDVLTDLKVNAFDKNNAMVLLHKQEIIWLVGYKISENYKVKDNTKNVLKVNLKKQP